MDTGRHADQSVCQPDQLGTTDHYGSGILGTCDLTVRIPFREQYYGKCNGPGLRYRRYSDHFFCNTIQQHNHRNDHPCFVLPRNSDLRTVYSEWYFTQQEIIHCPAFDANGSFAAPTSIGTLASITSGTISAIIPSNAPVGAGYLVRVVSTTPVTVGTPFAVSISVSEAPLAGDDGSIVLCKNSGTYALFQLLTGSPSTCGTWAGPTGALSGGLFNTTTNTAGAYVYTTNCQGACLQDVATLTVTLQNPANAGSDVTAALCSNDPPTDVHDLVLNGDLDGFFYYQGQSSPQPDLTIPGTYPLTYIVFGVGPCANDTSISYQ